MKPLLLLTIAALYASADAAVPSAGLASWYGEAHRGRLMANGKKFNPDRLTAASWFYPLGTCVRVTINAPELVGKVQPPRTILVTVTDRGPARRLVRDGRIIDLTHAAFRALAHPDLGLVQVKVEPELRVPEAILAAKMVRPTGGVRELKSL
jgi:rare lipoprotein A